MNTKFLSRVKSENQNFDSKVKIYLGADHRGYHLKEKVARWLFNRKYQFVDLGAENLDLNDDYTLYAAKVASIVAETKPGVKNSGILFCGSGVGVDVVANKFDGIRAGLGLNPRQVESARSDDDINILVLAADFTSESEAVLMVEAFIKTAFAATKKHKRRIEDIKRVEANN